MIIGAGASHNWSLETNHIQACPDIFRHVQMYPDLSRTYPDHCQGSGGRLVVVYLITYLYIIVFMY